jgi:3-hydroxyisobutyrate dehydrogenase-like beta-hydroxyacid dehydrogenase
VIGFVGLGAMGSRMARRLLDAGHELAVWNRTSEKAQPLLAGGARRAQSPAGAAHGAEAVIVMVSDPAALEAVMWGPEGVAAGLAEGAVVIQMSTVSPQVVDRLAAEVPLLDAPVLGSISEAEQGTLNIFASGPDELVQRWTPLLSTLGAVLPVGPVGAGTAAKLVANLTLVGTIGVLGETIALARVLGLADETTFEVLAATPLAAQAERRLPAFESGEYPPRFPTALARKDAELIVEAAAELRLANAARSWLADAEASGRGADDYSSVLAEIAKRVTGTR